MEVLLKDIIVTWILPHLPFRPAAELAEVVAVILYKLKIGCQRFRPVGQLLPERPLSW